MRFGVVFMPDFKKKALDVSDAFGK